MDYWRDGCLKGIAYWIYDFQVLIGAILASIAAMTTICYIRKQISQSEKHRRDELISLKTAEKVQAVWVFLKLSQYDSECLNYISESYIQKDAYKYAVSSLDRPPEIDLSVIPTLARLAANSSPEISSKIQNYLAHLQIQNSRLVSLRESLAGRATMPDGSPIGNLFVLEQAMFDHYVLKFQSNKLLGYCRGDYDGVPDLMSEEEFKNQVSGFPDVNFLTERMIDHMADLWPKEGWWKISS